MHYRKTVLCIVLNIIVPITSRELEEEPAQQVTVQNDCFTFLYNNLIPMKRSREEGRKSKEEEATSYMRWIIIGWILNLWEKNDKMERQ